MVLLAVAVAGLLAVLFVQLRPRTDYSALIRDIPGGPPAPGASLLGRSGYGAVGTSAPVGTSRDIEVTTFARPAATGAPADAPGVHNPWAQQ